MSTSNDNQLPGAVYLHVQVVEPDPWAKAEVSAGGRIQLHIGPWSMSLNIESAELIGTLLLDAVNRAALQKMHIPAGLKLVEK